MRRSRRRGCRPARSPGWAAPAVGRLLRHVTTRAAEGPGGRVVASKGGAHRCGTLRTLAARVPRAAEELPPLGGGEGHRRGRRRLGPEGEDHRGSLHRHPAPPPPPATTTLCCYLKLARRQCRPPAYAYSYGEEIAWHVLLDRTVALRCFTMVCTSTNHTKEERPPRTSPPSPVLQPVPVAAAAVGLLGTARAGPARAARARRLRDVPLLVLRLRATAPDQSWDKHAVCRIDRCLLPHPNTGRRKARPSSWPRTAPEPP